MTRLRRPRARLVAVFALSATAALAASAAAVVSTPPQRPLERLPDLAQRAPRDLVVTQEGWRFRLGFESAVENHGTAALVVAGAREPPVPTMRAWQVVGGRRVADVGVLSYVVDGGHEHWHLLPFEQYELHRASDGRLAASALKSGFCLGDRYRAPAWRTLPRAGPRPAFTSRCGLRAPHLRTIREGISVGYGDDYPATLEGQYFDVTSLAGGDYFLVLRVDAERRIRELSVRNNVAWLRVRISWPHGPHGLPAVESLGSCELRATCASVIRARAPSTTARGSPAPSASGEASSTARTARGR